MPNGAAWYHANKERAKDSERLRLYGVTRGQFEEMLERQGGLCAVCRRQRRLVVDHDHQTGAFRGLLCTSCNVALGKLGDTVEGLQRALAYLEKSLVLQTPR